MDCYNVSGILITAIDRIEEGRAVLLSGDDGRDHIDIPAYVLPEGSHEGDRLVLLICVPRTTQEGQNGT